MKLANAHRENLLIVQIESSLAETHMAKETGALKNLWRRELDTDELYGEDMEVVARDRRRQEGGCALVKGISPIDGIKGRERINITHFLTNLIMFKNLLQLYFVKNFKEI